MLAASRLSTDTPVELRAQLALMLRTTLGISGDKGYVQLFYPADCSLRIVAQFGFDREFLDFFSVMQEGQGACGTALLRRERVMVEDVATDPIFAGTEAREVLLIAGVRAVQSTPMLHRSGEPLGVLSCHYHKPTRPSFRDLRTIDELAGKSADLIERAFRPVRWHAENWNAVLANNGRANGNSYSLFCRTEGCVSFVETIGSWGKAIRRLQRLSLKEPAEFVLFDQLNVIAVAEGGIVAMRNSSGMLPCTTMIRGSA